MIPEDEIDFTLYPYKVESKLSGTGLGQLDSEFGDRMDWCQSNLQGKWCSSNMIYSLSGHFLLKFHFELSKDAVLFKMRW